MATYHVQTEDIEESASWLQQNMHTLLDGMTQAKTRIDSLIQGGYNTPGALEKSARTSTSTSPASTRRCRAWRAWRAWRASVPT